MKIAFYKYHGTGNDFVMIDNRGEIFPVEDNVYISGLCHRRFGIGADGVICLEENTDGYYMRYFNANGSLGSMCGNGGRCFVHFADFLGLVEHDNFAFYAYDGLHEALIEDGLVSLKMADVNTIDQRSENDFVLDTGSPHYVKFVENLSGFDVEKQGKAIRHNEEFDKDGVNVNFLEVVSYNKLIIKTFERGVESVTFACGTGAVASAMAWHYQQNKGVGDFETHLQTDGGVLVVSFTKNKTAYTNVWLKGPSVCSFSGVVEMPNVL